MPRGGVARYICVPAPYAVGVLEREDVRVCGREEGIRGSVYVG